MTLSPAFWRTVGELALGGFGVAFFAWLFDLARRIIFGQIGVASKSMLHGWTNYRLSQTEIELTATKFSIDNPQAAIARMIFGAMGILLMPVLISVTVLLDFVRTYFPSTREFSHDFPTFTYSLCGLRISDCFVHVDRRGRTIALECPAPIDGQARSEARPPQSSTRSAHRRPARLVMMLRRFEICSPANAPLTSWQPCLAKTGNARSRPNGAVSSRPSRRWATP
jgi:hypothetical protein